MTAVQEVLFTTPTNKLVKVTPEIATEYLARSDLNRRLSRDRAIELAKAFNRGEHRLTGDAIVFNKQGLMTNGQHRMLAIVIAGNPEGFEFWVMEGADEDEQMVQDTGRSRSFTDHLRIRGVPNATAVSGVTKLYWNYTTGTIHDPKLWHARISPTVFQLDKFFADHEDTLKEGIRHADTARRKLPLTVSVLAVAWITFSAIDEADAQGFWDQLTMKTEAGSPVRSLISQVLTKRKARPGRRETGWYSSFDSRHQLALIIKAWNAFREGREIQQLVFKSGGVAPEGFPKAK